MLPNCHPLQHGEISAPHPSPDGCHPASAMRCECFDLHARSRHAHPSAMAIRSRCPHRGCMSFNVIYLFIYWNCVSLLPGYGMAFQLFPWHPRLYFNGVCLVALLRWDVSRWLLTFLNGTHTDLPPSLHIGKDVYSFLGDWIGLSIYKLVLLVWIKEMSTLDPLKHVEWAWSEVQAGIILDESSCIMIFVYFFTDLEL